MNYASHRAVSARLAIAIFIMPLIFAWFTLREGYTTLARVVSLGYAAFALLFNIIIFAALASAGSEASDLANAPPVSRPAIVEEVTLPAKPAEETYQASAPEKADTPYTAPVATQAAPPAQTAWAPGLPGYDIKRHCNELGSMGGGTSYNLIEMCHKQEMEAVRDVNSVWTRIPSDTKAHCNDLATTGNGGSYNLLQMCIKQEMEARSRLGQ